MEISSSNPLNIQLASFARTLEWKLKKQNEEKQSEYMKIKELCKTKEKPLTITNLYYSGQVAGSSCIECHPNITSIFQKSFTTLRLKDLLHRKCNKNVKEVAPSKQEVQLFHQCSTRSSLTYYFMRAASWVMYQTFSFWYKGVLIHPEHIECIKQAQDTGSSILFFIPTQTPDVWTLCSLYFALYYSGLRPPELCGFENLSWLSRFLFSRLGCLRHGSDPASIITHSVGPFYSDYVNYIIDDVYVVPVAVAFDQFIHVNLATPYALSELEIKYSAAELEDESDVNDVRDIDDHIKTDCFQSIPVTALCFVAYVVIACRTGDVILEDTLYQSAQRMRAELIREKVNVNFKGKTENIVHCALKLLSPHLTSRRAREGTEIIVHNMNKLVHCAMVLVMKKLLVCLVTAVVYSFSGDVLLTFSNDLKIQFDQNGDKDKPNDSVLNIGTVKHSDILSKSLEVVKQVERKLTVKVLKYCQNREDEINKTIGELTDWQILLSTDRALLEEERWCQNIIRSLDMENEDSSQQQQQDKRCYNLEALDKSPVARSYISIATSLNHV